VQWINAGAGIWKVNSDNSYPEVDNELLDGFTAQEFRPIGSVKINGEPSTKVASLLELSTLASAFYYADSTLWITCPGFNEPALYAIDIGESYSFATHSFVPINGPVPIEGRLAAMPSVTMRRDPLFFGRLQYDIGTLRLLNGDGEFDTWGTEVDIYGNAARVMLGDEDVDYNEWLSAFAGTMEAITVDERSATIVLADKRKQLTRAITYSCTDLNALSAIEEILLDAYGYTYGATFFDTEAWEAARGEVENVTIDMQEPDSAISVIERIAASVFGVFRYDALERFTFRVIEDDEDTVATIYAIDVLEERRITYDPTQVVSSVRVGYALDWATDEYTYLVDTSVEDTVFRTYKTYNQRTIETVLPDLTAAQSFATRVLDYVSTVRGVETITVSVSFAGLEIGDQIALEVARGTQSMIGWLKAEVIGVEYAQEAPVMRLTVRHGAAIE
jgi:hypothetical protein